MMSPEARFRRFARAVTTEVGALEDSFLGRGRSLGAARVLNAIGRGMTDVAAVREYLRIDSGLLSRLLRGLEAEKLIELSPDGQDGRRRIAALTRAGKREFLAYEKLSDQRARQLIESIKARDHLLMALDAVATALTVEQTVIERVSPDCDVARYCLGQYYEELNARFEQGFEVGRSRDPDRAKMTPPRGGFLVVLSDGLPIGCGALCGDGSHVAEVKRVWVAPCARGLGVAQRLMGAIEDLAREYGVRELRLDTNKALKEAARFYLGLGWTPIPRFNDDPYADLFFAKALAKEAAKSPDA